MMQCVSGSYLLYHKRIDLPDYELIYKIKKRYGDSLHDIERQLQDDLDKKRSYDYDLMKGTLLKEIKAMPLSRSIKYTSNFRLIMTSFEEQTKRLERAKKQYELMLLHYSDDSIDDTSSASIHNGAITPTALTYRQSMVGEGYSGGTPQHRGSTSESTAEPIQVVHMSDKDLIITLQGEVERLRHKLGTVIDTVEHVVQEAQATQNDICGEFERQLHTLSTEKTALEDENYQLRTTLNLSQAELAVEREQLLKALQFIERLKNRGREYNIVRRKSDALLLSTSALTYSSGGISKSKPSAAIDTSAKDLHPITSQRQKGSK